MGRGEWKSDAQADFEVESDSAGVAVERAEGNVAGLVFKPGDKGAVHMHAVGHSSISPSPKGRARSPFRAESTGDV